MSVASAEPSAGMSREDREALERVMARIARNAGAIEQALETVEHLADSGALAGINAVLEEFDENFSATTRPELMGMVANIMMLLGTVSQLSYEPFFNTAMRVPAVMNEAYPRFAAGQEKLSLREAIRLMRSPEVASALRLMVEVLRAQRGQGNGG